MTTIILFLAIMLTSVAIYVIGILLIDYKNNDNLDGWEIGVTITIITAILWCFFYHLNH